MLLGSLPRFLLRLDVLRKRTAISLQIKNESFIQHFRVLLQSVIISVSEQHVVRELRTQSQNLRMLFLSIFIIVYPYIDILAYFLFKLHDQTSSEWGRQQQLTTRLSLCILDMCAKIMKPFIILCHKNEIFSKQVIPCFLYNYRDKHHMLYFKIPILRDASQ